MDAGPGRRFGNALDPGTAVAQDAGRIVVGSSDSAYAVGADALAGNAGRRAGAGGGPAVDALTVHAAGLAVDTRASKVIVSVVSMPTRVTKSLAA